MSDITSRGLFLVAIVAVFVALGALLSHSDNGSLQGEASLVVLSTEEANPSTIKLLSAPTSTVSRVSGMYSVTAGGVFFESTDYLSSYTMVSDEFGVRVSEKRYEPFGSLLVDNSQVLANAVERYSYTGKEKDTSGLIYYGARYYDSEIGRFLAADRITGEKIYAYADSNPLVTLDPDGNAVVRMNDGFMHEGSAYYIVASDIRNKVTFGNSVAGFIFDVLVPVPTTYEDYKAGLTQIPMPAGLAFDKRAYMKAYELAYKNSEKGKAVRKAAHESFKEKNRIWTKLYSTRKAVERNTAKLLDIELERVHWSLDMNGNVVDARAISSGESLVNDISGFSPGSMDKSQVLAGIIRNKIKDNYRALVKGFHPDTNTPAQGAGKNVRASAFNNIQTAKEGIDGLSDYQLIKKMSQKYSWIDETKQVIGLIENKPVN